MALLSLISGGLALQLQRLSGTAPDPEAGDPGATQADQDEHAAVELERNELRAQLTSLQTVAQAAQTEAKEAREEAELTLLQLHQVQEELEQVFLANQGKQKQVDDLTAQLEASKADATKAAASIKDQASWNNERQLLQQQLQAAETATRDAREEAELTLLQLHQVQEELEHYFLLGREQTALLSAHEHQQRRVRQLIKAALKEREASAVH
ncbi:hypothetical protein EVJ50_09395 [Synechococcus sp. RSCCF101]|nr:hypothetical protein EVJ50_09395 [Synechococcus sp. RSCCF101]